MMIDFTCCARPHLPAHHQVEASWLAALVRPENDRRLVQIAYTLPHEIPITPQHLTADRTRFWPNGYQILVAFKGGSPAINAHVMEHMNAWSEYANIGFRDLGVGGDPDVIVGYDQQGYWSNMGTDCRLYARRGQATMNLQGFDSGRMPESEWRRVVRHESGHTLGWWHEHMRPDSIARLNRQAVYAEYERTQGWSQQEIDRQIFTPLDMSNMIASPTAQDDSIMEYPFSASLTLDHIAIPGGTDITREDGRIAALAYPGTGPVHPQFKSFAEAV